MRISRRASLYSRKRQFSLSDVAAGETVYIPEKGVFKPYIVMGHNIYPTGEFKIEVVENSTIEFARSTYYCRYGQNLTYDEATREFIIGDGETTRLSNIDSKFPAYVGDTPSAFSTSVPTRFKSVIYGESVSGSSPVTITGSLYETITQSKAFTERPVLLLRSNLSDQQVYQEIESSLVVDTNEYMDSLLKSYLEETFINRLDISPLFTFIPVGVGGSSTGTTTELLQVFPPSASELGEDDSPVNDGELLGIFSGSTERKGTDETGTVRRYWTRTPDQTVNSDDVYTRVFVVSQYGTVLDLLTSRDDTYARPEFSLRGDIEIDPETMQIII